MLRCWARRLPVVAAVVLLALLAPSPAAPADAAPGSSPLPYGERGRGIGYGAVMADRGTAGQDRIATDLRFGWVKYQVLWKDLQPAAGGPLVGVDGLKTAVQNARARGLQVLIQVLEAPGWAQGTVCGENIAVPPRPDQYPALTAFMRALSSDLRGLVTGYEIWNEPNTRLEWGGCPPNAVEFARLMAAATAGVRAGDPEAIVVLGGLSNTGDGVQPGVPCDGRQAGTCGDLMFLQTIYQSGEFAPGRLWDALGHHPYGGTCPPEATPANPCFLAGGGLYFRRMESIRNIVNDFGVPVGESPLVPLWATEMGWLSDLGITGCNIGSKDGQKVTPAQQAQYMAGAYAYALANWPWAGPMFAFLPDYNVGFAPGDCDSDGGGRVREFRWYSAFTETGQLNAQGQALRTMARATPDLAVRWQDPPTVLPASLGPGGTATSVTVTLRNGVGSDVRQRVDLLSGHAESPADLLSWRTRVLRTLIPVPAPPPGQASQAADLMRSIRSTTGVLVERRDPVTLVWDCPWEWAVQAGYLAGTVLAPYRDVRSQQGSLPGGTRLVAVFDAHRTGITALLVTDPVLRAEALALITAFLPYVQNLASGDGSLVVPAVPLSQADAFLDALLAHPAASAALVQAITAERAVQGPLAGYGGLPVGTIASQVRARSAAAGIAVVPAVQRTSLAGGW